MRVLISGASGLIGLALTPALISAGQAPNQGNRRVTSRNQSRGQCQSYQSRSAADQYSHVPLLQANFAVSCSTSVAKSKTLAQFQSWRRRGRASLQAGVQGCPTLQA